MKEKKLPSFEELFGDLDYSSADEYRSVLSPAAYLTDIMNLKAWQYGDLPDAVDDRREDISQIPLNAENTITEIPHLDVVNGVMENKIAKLAVADAYEAVRKAVFPFNLPFNRSKAEIQILLDYFKSDPAKLYKLFTATPDALTSAKEYLGLSNEEYAVIATSQAGENELKKCYGIFKADETLQVLTDVKRFRKATELSALQVTELLFQDLSDEEKSAGISRRFFINNQTDAASDVYLRSKTVDEGTANPRLVLYVSDGTETVATGYFDRIHRFIRLSRKTGLSFADLDLILTTLCNGALDATAIQTIAVVKWMQATFEAPVEELCALFATMKAYGKGEVTEPADFFYRVYNKGHEDDIFSLAPAANLAEIRNRIQSALGLNETDCKLVLEYLKSAGKDIVALTGTLTVEWLTLPYRLKELADLIELEVGQLLTLFRLIDRNAGLIEKAKFPLPVDGSSSQGTAAIITGQASQADILWLVQLTAVLTGWMSASEITVEQLEFVCTEHSDGEVEGVLSGSAIADLVGDVAGQFQAALFKSDALQSTIIDSASAGLLYQKLSSPEVGICTSRGIIGRETAKQELLPMYKDVMREKLAIDWQDFQKTGLEEDVLKALFATMQNRDYVDVDGYTSDLAFFEDPTKLDAFLSEELKDDRQSAMTVFREIGERVKGYRRADDAADSECETIAQKIAVQDGRQKAVVFRSLEDGLNLSADIIELLVVTLFRTADEAVEAAVVRFMTPVLEAVERDAAGGEFVVDASWTTSLRRLQQFGLLVRKTDLKAKELAVLFRVKKVQNSLLEKLKLTPPFQSKIDASYVDGDGSVYLFNGDQYIHLSGKDYSVQGTGKLSDLPGFPSGFAAGVNAALRDTGSGAPAAATYFFSGNQYWPAELGQIGNTANRWGKVRNNIVDQNRVDAAYRDADETLFLFSGDQYVRYSPGSREFVDEGYPKNTLRNWNNEVGRIKLPVDIRKSIDSIFRDADGTINFFCDDKFVKSSKASEVLITKEHWGKVLNNIVDGKRIDAILVKNGKTFIFSGDQYVRYSGPDYTFVDEGYPRKIANNWNNEGIKNLSGDYLTKVDAAFDGVDGAAYFFSGNTFVTTEDNAGPQQINERWGKVRNNVRELSRVDAAFVKDGKTYLFSGDQYVRYSSSDYSAVDESYPKRIGTNWNSKEGCGSLPDTFNNEINATLSVPNGAVYFFSGNQSISSKPGAVPQEVNAVWATVRNNILKNNKVDAAFKAPDGKTYVFSGDQFYRYSGADYGNVDEGYPKAIGDRWGNLPPYFRTGIDAAFTFNVDGTERLYLFKGDDYVRYSGSNYAQIDPGYPRDLGAGPDPEGPWFNPIFYIRGIPHFGSIATIFTDVANDKPRINLFYYLDDGSEWFVKFEFRAPIGYQWSPPVSVATLKTAPFQTVDCGFMGADGKVYLFSGTQFAVRTGNYQGIGTPGPVNTKWGLVLNRFIELDRVDGAFATASAVYLFCDNQYIKYSGAIDPGSASFYVDEGYPKAIAGAWTAENAGIVLPSVFAAQGYAVLKGADGIIYAFAGNAYVSSGNSTPSPVNSFWGKVVNNIEAINRMDAAFFHAGKTYLFCGNQYTRYSGNYAAYSDEGYPRRIEAIAAEDAIAAAGLFPDGIDAIEEGTDGNIYVIRGSDLVSSANPTETVPLVSRFGAVRNTIASTGIIDSADLSAAGILYLFSGNQYCRYSGPGREHVDESYPKSIANWNAFETGGIPASVTQGITASFTDTDGKTYVFTETEYFIEGSGSDPAPTGARWGQVINNIQKTGIVDAAFILPTGGLCLFSGDQYALYSGVSRDYLAEGYPKRIASNWGSLPDPYRQGIDAGLVFDGRTYLTKGSTYVRYSDPTCTRIDAGFPREIAEWMNEKPEFPFNDVKTFQQLKALSRKFSAKDNSILDFLSGTGAGDSAVLSKVTKWPVEELAFLLTASEGVLSGTYCGSLQVLSELDGIFTASAKMGAMPRTLKARGWDQIHNPATADPASAALAAASAATFLMELLKAVTGSAAWEGLSRELHNKSNRIRRDALLGYLIYQMEQTPEDNWIDNPRDLYEYLLIDVEMGEDAITSRIQEAIMCMQLFYHRTLMNLEDEDLATMANVRHKLKSWWAWMKNYRVWEANRKVFLYPENYLRPELRATKSPEFKELEEALLQSDITTEAAERAYKTYLDKFSKLANLKIAGGYVYQRNLDADQTESAVTTEKKIIIFGYTRVEPKKYYCITGVIYDAPKDAVKNDQTIEWSPWKELGITINAQVVAPVYSFNRLFVFWVEDRKRDQSSYSGSGGVGPDTQKLRHDPVLFYSFQNHHGEWSPPQEVVNVGSAVDKMSKYDKTLEDQRAACETLFTEKKDADVDVDQVFAGARLYVTNPITATHYAPDEYIYISYQARASGPTRDLEFTFEGKVRSDLTFETGTDVSKAVNLVEKNIEFPFAKFGITAVDSVSHWNGYFNDSFSAPWFSFNAAGGSFLAKPHYVQDGPVQVDKSEEQDKPKLLAMDWPNYPDSGFTDQYDRKHVFYRVDINGDQVYAVVAPDNSTRSEPIPVKERWGKRNVFDWYPEDIVCAATVAGDLYIATGSRCITYTEGNYAEIAQKTVAETLTDVDLVRLLPGTANPVSWHLIKEYLGDFIDNLERAFVCNSDHRLYLVANIPDEVSGTPVKEITIPSMPSFCSEMAALVPGTAGDVITSWAKIDSATYDAEGGRRRLYLRRSDAVLVKDYVAGTDSIYSLDELTHPDLDSPTYAELPAGASETSWDDVHANLPDFIERMSGISRVSGAIALVASQGQDGYEYTIPVAGELFDAIAAIMNNDAVKELTDLTAAVFFTPGSRPSIKRLYLRSGEKVVIRDYSAGSWSLRDRGDLVHPDFMSEVPLPGDTIPPAVQSPWDEVAEDLEEFMVTVNGAVVWKESFYLLAPKAGGGYESTSPSAQAFWRTIGERIPAVSGFATIDAACVVTASAGAKLLVTSGSNVVVFDYSSRQWSLSSIAQTWGVAFDKVSALVQLPDGSVYLFSGQQYAEMKDGAFIAAPAKQRWGRMKNVLDLQTARGKAHVDAAFKDGDDRVYLVIGDYVLRYSDVDNDVIDVAFVDVKTLEYFGITRSSLQEEFASYGNDIAIDSVGTNTAFVQKVNGQEKLYLFVDIDATITTYIWKTRWVWVGGWRWSPSWLRKRRLWWGWWYPERYCERKDDKARKSAYVRVSRQGEVFRTDLDYPKVITGSWTNLPGDFNKMITATFEDKDEEGNPIFYVVRSVDQNEAGGPITRSYDGYVMYTKAENFPTEIAEVKYDIVRLTSGTSEALAQRLLVGGIDSLLSLDAQHTAESPWLKDKGTGGSDISGEADPNAALMVLNDSRSDDIIGYRNGYLVTLPEGTDIGPKVDASLRRLDFKSVNAQYYWEIFFHAPWLIAQAFNDGQNFEEARRWFEYVFDPTELYDDTVKSFWKFLPFHFDLDAESTAWLESAAQYARYREDPFDPHAIAELRQVAYRKAIVMAYIDNLIDHGDMLFRQYTRETINEARMLYVLAYDLLGKKPELLGTRKLSAASTYKNLNELDHLDLDSPFVALENAPESAVLPAGAADNPNGSILDVTGYFYIPENRDFSDYWERVEDRLYKIRQSLNIDGVKQKLALFEPPIDVMALVKAIGSGMSIAQALADFNIEVPHYRSSFLLAKARELASRLSQLGQNLLSALEKKDAEELALLRNAQEHGVLEMTLDIKNEQLKDCEETINALRANLKGAKTREAHYTSLIANGLSAYEQSQIGLLVASQVVTNFGQMFSVMSSAGGAAPEVGAFAFHFGGHNIALMFKGVSDGFGFVSSNLSMAANMSSILGGYQRRSQDWGLQKNLATCDIENIERQIAGAEIKAAIARQDIEIAKRNIKNNESVDTFMTGKFTNKELYRWMTGKLAGLYFQTYQMALDMAKMAQKALQFESGRKESDVNHIGSLYWDSLKKGLLAGETLQLDLDRMEKAHLEKNKRRFEISKTISLAQLDPLALLALRDKRACEFSLAEEEFDFDFPGHYCRQIKTISVTLPAVVGPYENINATLTQLSHKTLLEPAKAGVDHLLNPAKPLDPTKPPPPVRANWRVSEQVALSRGVNDSGLFQLNFQDERYLPFEGTGAVSTWRLELNGQLGSIDLTTMSDVIIKMEYTALQGGDVFAADVKKLLKQKEKENAPLGARMFNLARDFSAEWNAFMANPDQGISFKVTTDMFENLSKTNRIKSVYMVYMLSKKGVSSIGATAMLATGMVSTGVELKPVTLADVSAAISPNGSPWTLVPSANTQAFTPENIADIALVGIYERKTDY